MCVWDGYSPRPRNWASVGTAIARVSANAELSGLSERAIAGVGLMWAHIELAANAILSVTFEAFSHLLWSHKPPVYRCLKFYGMPSRLIGSQISYLLRKRRHQHAQTDERPTARPPE